MPGSAILILSAIVGSSLSKRSIRAGLPWVCSSSVSWPVRAEEAAKDHSHQQNPVRLHVIHSQLTREVQYYALIQHLPRRRIDDPSQDCPPPLRRLALPLPIGNHRRRPSGQRLAWLWRAGNAVVDLE